MKSIHENPILSCFNYFIKILLFLTIAISALADENKIGSVTEVNGTIVAINDELEERDLLIHDPIFLNEEIFVTERSSATIQFNDSTTVIMKELTSINVSEFENSKKNAKLKAELLKGKIIIESGSIAKKDDGEMIVGVTTSSLGLRGTRINIDLKQNGKSNISLATDSFGNVGAIEVTSEGQTSNITSTEQVLEISEDNETTSRDKTDDEKEEAVEKLGRGCEITRFKGLGEISPNEFGQFIGDDMRLIEVTVDKKSEIPELLQFFMGKNTPTRKNFIMDHLI